MIDPNEISWKVTAAPGAEPITLAQAKLQVKVETGDTDDDALITALIIAARQYCEGYQNKAYINQTITLKMNRFVSHIRLPRSPLGSVTSINYLDTAGDSQLLSTDVYAVDTTSKPGLITLKANQFYPQVQRIHHAITIVYVAGTGADATNVPQTLKQAMLLLVAHWYDNRNAACDVKLEEIPFAVKSLLNIDRCFL